MEKLLEALGRDYPHLQFTPSEAFCWSPTTKQVFYSSSGSPEAVWSILHETAHALLAHTAYSRDFELLQMEVAAWEHAKALAHNYGECIDEDHIQHCLDSYRDWLHRRSVCPLCDCKAVQSDNTRVYRCFNCHRTWSVAPSRFCRSYRQHQEYKKSPASLAVTDDFCGSTLNLA